MGELFSIFHTKEKLKIHVTSLSLSFNSWNLCQMLVSFVWENIKS